MGLRRRGASPRRPTLGAVAAVVAMSMVHSACSEGGADPGGHTSEPGPTAAWLFDGDLEAAAGEDVVLGTEGRVEQSREALSLDGGTGAAVTDGTGPIDTTASFTVAAWVCLRNRGMLGTPEYEAAVSQVGDVAGSFYLGVRQGNWDFTMKNADSNQPGTSISAAGPKAPADGRTWVHVAGVHDGEAHELRLYVDGEQVDEVPFDAPWSAEGPLTVGRALVHGGPGNFFAGAVGDLRVFDEALDGDAVAATVAQGKPTSPPPEAPPVSKDVRALDGVYVYDMTAGESRRMEEHFGPEAEAAGFPGQASVVQEFSQGLWQQYYLVDGKPYLLNGHPEGDAGVATVDGDVLTLDNGAGAVQYRYRLRDQGLSLRLLSVVDPVVSFVMEHDYRRT